MGSGCSTAAVSRRVARGASTILDRCGRAGHGGRRRTGRDGARGVAERAARRAGQLPRARRRAALRRAGHGCCRPRSRRHGDPRADARWGNRADGQGRHGRTAVARADRAAAGLGRLAGRRERAAHVHGRDAARAPAGTLAPDQVRRPGGDRLRHARRRRLDRGRARAPPGHAAEDGAGRPGGERHACDRRHRHRSGAAHLGASPGARTRQLVPCPAVPPGARGARARNDDGPEARAHADLLEHGRRRARRQPPDGLPRAARRLAAARRAHARVPAARARLPARNARQGRAAARCAPGARAGHGAHAHAVVAGTCRRNAAPAAAAGQPRLSAARLAAGGRRAEVGRNRARRGTSATGRSLPLALPAHAAPAAESCGTRATTTRSPVAR